MLRPEGRGIRLLGLEGETTTPSGTSNVLQGIQPWGEGNQSPTAEGRTPVELADC